MVLIIYCVNNYHVTAVMKRAALAQWLRHILTSVTS